MPYRVRLAEQVYASLEKLSSEVRYEVETQLKSLAIFPETGESFDFPFAGGRRWRFMVPTEQGERVFSTIFIPDYEKAVVEVVGFGEIDVS